MHAPVKQEIKIGPKRSALTLRLVKQYLLIDHNEDDAYLQVLIEAADAECERFTNRALITQTRVVWYDSFCSDYLPLRYGPIQEVVKASVFDSDNAETVIYDPASDPAVGTDIYRLTDSTMVGAFTLNTHQYWNTTYLRYREGIRIEYICGYGDDERSVPAELKIGLLEYIKFHYHDDAEGSLPSAVTRPWNKYRIIYT